MSGASKFLYLEVGYQERIKFAFSRARRDKTVDVLAFLHLIKFCTTIAFFLDSRFNSG